MEDFVVFIIESQKPEEILFGEEEGAALHSALENYGVTVEILPVVNKSAFYMAFQYIYNYFIDLEDDIEDEDELPIPLLHFSVHGDKDGIQLTSEEDVGWAELRDCLTPLNDACEDLLLVGMSSCFGLEGMRMARSIKKPFYALVGPRRDVEWDDAKVAFTTFYHLITKKETYLDDAASAMNLSAGVPPGTFDIVLAKEVQMNYIREVHAKVKRQRFMKAIRRYLKDKIEE